MIKAGDPDAEDAEEAFSDDEAGQVRPLKPQLAGAWNFKASLKSPLNHHHIDSGDLILENMR